MYNTELPEEATGSDVVVCTDVTGGIPRGDSSLLSCPNRVSRGSEVKASGRGRLGCGSLGPCGRHLASGSAGIVCKVGVCTQVRSEISSDKIFVNLLIGTIRDSCNY